MTEGSSTDEAQRFIELINDEGDPIICARTFLDTKSASSPKSGQNYSGRFSKLLPNLEADNAAGCGVFAVVNGGGHRDGDITRFRALFVDGDDMPLPNAWHVEPDFLVIRDDRHWHAYWRIMDGAEPEEWLDGMRRLALHYGTDAAICNRSRVMRIPGFLHLKDPSKPNTVALKELPHAELPRRHIIELTEGLPALPPRVRSHRTGDPVTRAALEEMLGFIDPDCDRNTWLAVAGGLMNANVVTSPGGPSDETFDGLEVFTYWSAGEYRRHG